MHHWLLSLPVFLRVLPQNSQLPSRGTLWYRQREKRRGRPSLWVDAVFQRLGFRCHSIGRWGQAHWTSLGLTPCSLRGPTSSHPPATAPEAWRERPPHGKEGPAYSALKGTRNDQHPGETGPQERERPVALFHPEPPGPSNTPSHFSSRKGGDTSSPRPSVSKRLQTIQICKQNTGENG